MTTLTEPTAYPLAWPPGPARTPPGRRQRARFGKKGAGRAYGLQPLTIGQGLRRLRDELETSRAYRVTISTNLRLGKRDGHPLASQRAPDDPGVAVYFSLHADGEPRCMPCDRWDRVADNLAAVAAAIAALRGLDRWVNDSQVRAAFAGFALALPTPESVTDRAAADWRTVLGMHGVSDEEINEAGINDCYRYALRTAHPDRGGSPEKLAVVKRAREFAIDYCRELRSPEDRVL